MTGVGHASYEWRMRLMAVDIIGIPVEVITGVGGLLLGAAGAWTAASTARERRQPIVVAHEDKSRTMSKQAGSWYVLAHLTNESGPTAFNVRFGVEYAGIRFPYKLDIDDPDAGNIQRVVQSAARLPESEQDSFPILISSSDLWHTAAVRGRLGERRIDQTAIYWCRYENALGQTWETRNPGDRSASLDIRRVWRAKRVEERESQKRLEMRTEGREWEAQALDELRAEHPDLL